MDGKFDWFLQQLVREREYCRPIVVEHGLPNDTEQRRRSTQSQHPLVGSFLSGFQLIFAVVQSIRSPPFVGQTPVAWWNSIFQPVIHGSRTHFWNWLENSIISMKVRKLLLEVRKRKVNRTFLVVIVVEKTNENSKSQICFCNNRLISMRLNWPWALLSYGFDASVGFWCAAVQIDGRRSVWAIDRIGFGWTVRFDIRIVFFGCCGI